MKDAPEGMRPIGARLLKSAIDTLRPHLREATVLELFSGTGRFGFECLKENAASITFVEQSKKMVGELKKLSLNNRYKNQEIKILQCDAFNFLKSSASQYEIVFADPPFSDWNPDWQNRFFSALTKAFADEAILLVKCPSQMIVCPKFDGLSPLKETIIGESKLLYYQYGKKQTSQN